MVSTPHYHLFLFVKANSSPILIGTEFEFHLAVVITAVHTLQGSDGHKEVTVTGTFTVCRLRITAFCLPASVFIDL